MNELQPVITEFKNNHLNEIGAELISLSKDTNNHLTQAKQHVKSAILNRWNRGRIIAENIEEILDECGTQRKFSERIGLTEAMISNDKRGYLAAKEAGAETEEEFLNLLSQKQIPARTDRWEKLPKLLNDPESRTKTKDQRQKDEKRLEDLHAEIEEIKARNEGANPVVAERAEDTLRYSEGVKQHIEAQDIFKSGWRNRDYLDFVKSIGFDYLTMEPCKNPDPHHVLPSGRSQGPHGKVADVFTFPISRPNHDSWQGKNLTIKEQLEVSEALIRTMALFITTNLKSD